MLRFFIFIAPFLLPNLALGSTIQQLEAELKKQKYASAATTGLSLLRQQPDNIQAQFLTALAFQNNDQLKQAKRYYQQIIETHPELPEPRNNLAMIYLEQGQHDRAVNLLIASLKTHPAYATAWQNLSNLYKGLASEAYRKALNDGNDTQNVKFKIQLTALNNLHSYSVSTKKIPAKPIQIAKYNPKKANSSKPQPKPVIEKTSNSYPQDNNQLIISAVKNWASAWSQKDFDLYTNAYTRTFKGKAINHQEWMRQREKRIKKPGNIDVTLTNIRVKSQNKNRATVDFVQSFKSPRYSDKVIKRLYLDKMGNHWKISREKTLAVL